MRQRNNEVFCRIPVRPSLRILRPTGPLAQPMRGEGRRETRIPGGDRASRCPPTRARRREWPVHGPGIDSRLLAVVGEPMRFASHPCPRTPRPPLSADEDPAPAGGQFLGEGYVGGRTIGGARGADWTRRHDTFRQTSGAPIILRPFWTRRWKLWRGWCGTCVSGSTSRKRSRRPPGGRSATRPFSAATSAWRPTRTSGGISGTSAPPSRGNGPAPDQRERRTV